ncbi:hypothetical protein [Patulibacter minatonensis]|uniref:hypothetical protein n=1 Tax=Patulibacter minatonensis TaxID=298163 RepID=UPI00047B124C|nr:hypothetical protein [Patulibacter minatonensis]
MRRPRSARRAEPPFWLARLRWKVRGQSARIAYVAAVAAGVLILAVLPPTGDPGVTGRGILLLLGLVAVLSAVGGIVIARVLRRRDPSLPRIVARDRAASVAVGLGVLGLCVGGILHRPAVVEKQQRFDAQVAEARRLAERRAPAYAIQRLDEANVRRLSVDVLRVCFPVGRPDRAWCAIVGEDRGVPRARADSDPRSNAVAAREADDGS